HHPAQRLALLSGKMFGLIPNLHENFLQEIIGFGFVVNHPEDERLQDAVVPIVKLRESFGVTGLDSLHQVQVARRPRFKLRRSGERSRSRLCQAHALLWLAARGGEEFRSFHAWSGIGAIRTRSSGRSPSR